MCFAFCPPPLFYPRAWITPCIKPESKTEGSYGILRVEFLLSSGISFGVRPREDVEPTGCVVALVVVFFRAPPRARNPSCISHVLRSLYLLIALVLCIVELSSL